MREKFGELSYAATGTPGLNLLENYLNDKSYLSDSIPTQLDVQAFKIVKNLEISNFTNFANIRRWLNHIESFKNEFEFLPEAQF